MKIAIVGAGISGLATAHAVLARDPSAEVVVFEAAGRVGGKVWTEASPEGYLCEGGVNGFLDKVPATLDLCRDLSLEPLGADAAAQQRFVFSAGALHRLPESPGEFMASGLLSLGGRLRVLGEVLVGRSSVPDESVAAFGNRRLGREATQKLIDPMVAGVFAGKADQASLASCFPRIHEVEAEHRSLILGLIKLQRRARKAGRGDRPGPGPGGRLTSFGAGMGTLTDRLAETLGARVRTGCAVAGIDRDGARYVLDLGPGGTEEADRVILAIPAYAQAAVLRELEPALTELLNGIEYPPLSVVCFGFEPGQPGPYPGGFGFLVPSRERRSILGTVVDSNVFPGRAPAGCVLMRSMVGGARSPALAELPDEALIDAVAGDLEEIVGLKSEPGFCRIFRHQRAIPQYTVGHGARLAAIDQALEPHPGLYLTGNAFRGVSLNDCVVNALRTADCVFGIKPGSGAP